MNKRLELDRAAVFCSTELSSLAQTKCRHPWLYSPPLVQVSSPKKANVYKEQDISDDESALGGESEKTAGERSRL